MFKLCYISFFYSNVIIVNDSTIKWCINKGVQNNTDDVILMEDLKEIVDENNEVDIKKI